MKILYLYFGSASPVFKYERNLIENINKKYSNIKLDIWDWTGELKLKFNPSLRWAYKNQDLLKQFYKALEKKILKYDALFIAQTGGLIPEFLERIKIFKIYNTADDPESSHLCSFPFLNVVDVIVHAGYSYFNDVPLGYEFEKRGAKKAYYMPIGFYEEMFPPLTDFDKTFLRRHQKIIFVGRPRIQRIKLVQLFNTFGDDIRVHNRRTPTYQKIFWKMSTGLEITPFEGSLADLYASSQIGINMHLSSGPSNVRTYQLPASGVAQVIDCKKTISELFIPDKEIATYDTIDEAISLIRKLINDEELRYQISKNGYIKARNFYNREKLIYNMINDILL